MVFDSRFSEFFEAILPAARLPGYVISKSVWRGLVLDDKIGTEAFRSFGR